MHKRFIYILLVSLFSLFLCSCSHANDNPRESFDKYVLENNGFYDLIKDVKIKLNDNTNVNELLNSVKTSKIEFKNPITLEEADVYIIKNQNSINISGIQNDEIVFSENFKKEDLEKLYSSDDNGEYYITIGNLIDNLKEELDLNIDDIIKYDFTNRDFVYNPANKHFIITDDAKNKFFASLINNISKLLGEDTYESHISSDNISKLFTDNGIITNIEFGFENNHFTTIILGFTQNMDNYINDINYFKESSASITINCSYDKENNLEIIEIDGKASINNVDTYYEDNKGGEGTKKIDFTIQGYIKKDDINISLNISKNYKNNEIINTSAMGKKASQTESTINKFEIKSTITYDGSNFKINFDINGKDSVNLSGNYVSIESIIINGNSWSYDSKILPVDTSKNYKLDYIGSFTFDYSVKDNELNANIKMSGNNSKSIDLKGSIKISDWIDEFSYSSICKIKSLSSIKLLNFEINYSKISNEEIPECLR